MTHNSASNNAEHARQAREFEARAAFKGMLDITGVEIIDEAMQRASAIIEEGKRGFALPTEDHSLMITIDAYNVHFSVPGWRGYSIPLDAARTAIMEVSGEQVAE